MSEQVSRAEFNELKGQLDLVCQHLGLELGEFVSQGSGRRRAATVETNEVLGFVPEETFAPVFLPVQETTPDFADEDTEEETDSEEGWESINDDEDPDHTISYGDDEDSKETELSVEDLPFEEESPFEEVPVVQEEVRHLPTTLNYVPEVKDDSNDEPLFSDEDEDDNDYSSEAIVEEVDDSSVNPDLIARIFDVEGVLTANDVASKQFNEIKKSLFTSPYDVDAVDEFLDEYLEVLQTKEISESKYAEALLNLDGRKFPENSEGYKKAEVDSFVAEISAELKRRIEIVS
jgi:hypothetical protein